MHLVLLQLVGGIEDRSDAGGGTSSLLELAGAWRANGHSVHLITANPRFFAKYLPPDSRIDPVPYAKSDRMNFLARFGLQLVANPGLQSRILETLFEQCRRDCPAGPRVVIGTSPYFPDLRGLLIASRVLHSPCVAYEYHVVPPPWWHARARGNPWRNLLAWGLGAFSLGVVKIAGFTPAFCQESNLLRAGWRFSGPAVFTYGFAPAPPVAPSRPIGDRPLVACSIARIMPSKGIADLVRAWKLVVKELPSAELFLAGPVHSPSYQHSIERVVAREKLERNVRFLGRVSEGDKQALLGRSRLFLSASYEEGWSYSVMEAVCAGLTPIVYDIPAYAHLGGSAVRVPPGDIPAFARSVVREFGVGSGSPELVIAKLREVYSLDNVAKRQLAQFEAL
jgi:glycosyltransferase involved in cell wall biosynthesis